MVLVIFWMITNIEHASADVEETERHWTAASVALHVVLPMAGLALLWGQRGIFAKILLQLDRSCVSVYCPSLSQRDKLLKWAGGRLPSTWSSPARTLSSGIAELWRDGSLLCTLINSAVPGACPNPPRHWRKPPLHAQALAYKYLGLTPIFTDSDFSGDLTINQERKFLHYMQELQHAITKWQTKDDTNRKFSCQYVARGMGLVTGEQHRKAVFYVYSDVATKKRGDVLMYIRGPYGTEGTATVPPFHSLKSIPVVNVLQDQLEATKTTPFKSSAQKSFLKTISLDFTSLISKVEGSGIHDDIPIHIDMEIDRAKVTYIPGNTGMYEINLISDGELLRGSPYNVHIINNSTDKKDTFNTECENVEEKITFTKRTVLSKVIDCIDEKIYIDNDKVSKVKLNESSDSSTSESDNLKITAITKKNDEILKTEIICGLEDILEELQASKPFKDDIAEIAQELSEVVPVETVPDNKLDVDTQHVIVKNIDQAKTEIVNILQQEPDEEPQEADSEEEVPHKPDTVMSNLAGSTKFIKELLNCTSRQEILAKIAPVELTQTRIKSGDENNNSKPALKRITSTVHLEITPPKTTPASSAESRTSPICPDHIAPEVENTFKQLPVSEKRKIFSKQDGVMSSLQISTFSVDSEIGSEDKSRNSSFQELSVLNVLDSIKSSCKNSQEEDPEPCSITSTNSLPNITTDDADYFGKQFKTKRDYWERMSSQSSSNVSLSNSDYGQNRRVTFKMGTLHSKSSVPKEVAQSVDDLSRFGSFDRKYKSVDNALDDCVLMSIEERKRNLLKNLYDNEARVKKRTNRVFPVIRKLPSPVSNSIEKIPEQIQPTVGEKIQQFDNKLVVEATLEVNCKGSKNIVGNHKSKSQFKRIMNMFKKLDIKSKEDKFTVTDNKNMEKRRNSLDPGNKNKPKTNRGGSLNLPHISDRFSLNNLYADVLGNRNGSFRGAPNKQAVIDSLRSYSKKSNVLEKDSLENNENSIKYNLFLNKAKTKKRKSLKALMNVIY